MSKDMNHIRNCVELFGPKVTGIAIAILGVLFLALFIQFMVITKKAEDAFFDEYYKKQRIQQSQGSK